MSLYVNLTSVVESVHCPWHAAATELVEDCFEVDDCFWMIKHTNQQVTSCFNAAFHLSQALSGMQCLLCIRD